MHLRVALDEALFLRATHSADAPVEEVCTLVVYQGTRPWPDPPRAAFGNTGAYHLLQLHALREQLRKRAPLRARLAIRFLAAAALKDDDAMRACLRSERHDLRRLRREQGPEAVAVFARYVLSTTEKLPREAMMAQIQRIDDELVEPFVSAYDAIFQEGVEKGAEQGKRQTLATTLMRIAARHLPDPTPAHRQRVEQADAPQLDAWIDALLQDNPPATWDALLR